MDSKKLKTQFLLTLGSIMAVLAGITAVTYAWLTYNAATNVEPMASTIGEGGGSLLIANTADGSFETECTLVFDTNPTTLSPVSTANLTNFYRATAQNREGISILYEDATDQIADYVISGAVYLQSTGGTNQVYFLPSAFSIGSDMQSMSALRLGMQITVDGQETTYLFQLDGLVSGTPESTLTVPSQDTVVSGISGSGAAEYTQDPQVAVTDYMAVEDSAEDTTPAAGTTALFSLPANQVATVRYWVYLEGCDENCLTSVQSQDVPIQLGFAGVPQEGE